MIPINARTGKMTAAAVSPGERPFDTADLADDDELDPGPDTDPVPVPDADAVLEPEPEPEPDFDEPPPAVVVGTTSIVVPLDPEDSVKKPVDPVTAVPRELDVEAVTETPPVDN